MFARDRHPLLLPIAVTLLLIAGIARFAWAWGPGDAGAFDSAYYLDGARHLARGDGYVSAAVTSEAPSFQPIVRWAPGFSALIAPLIRSGLPPLTAAGVVLGACYLIAVVSVFGLALEFAGSQRWPSALLVCLVFATQPSVLASMDVLLSDLPCAAFTLFAWLVAWRLVRAQPRLTLSLAFGALLAAICLLRYAGLFLVAGLLLGVACSSRDRLPTRLRRLGPSVLVLAIGFGGWLLRNRAIGAGAFGDRAVANSTLSTNLARASAGAFAPLNEFDRLARSLFDAAWLLPVLGYSALFAWLSLAFHTRRAIGPKLLMSSVPIAVYAAAMVSAATFVHFDAINTPRFWIPIWPMLSLVLLIPAWHASGGFWLVPRALLHLVLIAALALFGTRTLHTLDHPQAKRGLLSDAWQRAAAQLPEPNACRLYVNDQRPFMLHRELGPTPQIPETIEEMMSALSHFDRVCIATTSRKLRLSSTAERRRKGQTRVIDALFAQGKLERVATADQVTLFHVRPFAQR